MIGVVLAEKYEIQKKIGQGGFGTVYQGTDHNLKRQVAIKILDRTGDEEGFAARFRREAESMAQLKHANIVTVYDYGEHEERPYLVMELVKGPSLLQLVGATTLKLTQVCALAQQICRAMAYAHEQGVVHRDLTLKNILAEEGGDKESAIKILDFGLAKLMQTQLQTSGKAAMGTPSYMSPEQIRRDAVDGRTDIFACGVGLYRMVNGCFPFESEHPTAVVYQILNKTNLEFSEGVPQDLRDIILRCLEKDPRSRPRDFGELGLEFEMLLNSLQTAQMETTVPLAPVGAFAERSSKRNPYLNRVMIKNPADFFGREKEVRKIYSRLDAPHPQSISIVGDRRIGKSSLLNFIYQRSNRKRHMQNYENAIFVYMDFQSSADIDVTAFIDFLFSSFRYETNSSSKVDGADRTLDHLKEIVQMIHDEGRRIIVLMDEFERITRNEKFEESFFSFLRALANSYRVAYVTSSGAELQSMCHNKDISDSPFFNIFSNLPLRPFSSEEAEGLISVPSRTEGVPLQPYAEKILELAGRFPMYLQMACSIVFEQLAIDGREEPDWAQVAESFADEVTPHYEFIWERMEEVEKENLYRVAVDLNVGKKYEYVSEDLVRRGYIVKEDGQMLLFSSSFRDFVLHREVSGKDKKSLLSSFWGKMRGGG